MHASDPRRSYPALVVAALTAAGGGPASTHIAGLPGGRVEDLLRRPAAPGVIAEGFRLLPRLVKPLLAEPGHAVWLLPTPGFRRAAFARRGSLRQIAGKTSDPERALGNLLERDRMFTERLREETGPLELRAIEVDGTMTEDGLDERVTEAFGL